MHGDINISYLFKLFDICYLFTLIKLLPNEIAVGIGLPAISHRAIAVEELLEERRTGEPHPRPRVNRPIGVQEQLVEYLRKQDFYTVTL